MPVHSLCAGNWRLIVGIDRAKLSPFDGVIARSFIGDSTTPAGANYCRHNLATIGDKLELPGHDQSHQTAK